MSANKRKKALCLIAEASDTLAGVICALELCAHHLPREANGVRVAQGTYAVTAALERCEERLSRASLLLD